MWLESESSSSLRRIAGIKVAGLLWKTPKIRCTLKNIFANKKGKIDFTKDIAAKYQLYAEVTAQVDSLPLSPRQKFELAALVKRVGEHTLLWLMRTSRELLPFKGYHKNMRLYIDCIRWTIFGLVDEAATFRMMHSPPRPVFDYNLWAKACELCVEEVVHGCVGSLGGLSPDTLWVLHQHAWLRDNPSAYYEEDFWSAHERFVRRDYSSHLIVYWSLRKHRKQSSSDWTIFIEFLKNIPSCDYCRIYNAADSVESNMLAAAVLCGNYTAVRYFWEKLSTTQRSKMMVQAALVAVWRGYKQKYLQGGGNQPFTDIMVFFMQRMSLEQLNQLLNNDHAFVRNALLRRDVWQKIERLCVTVELLSNVRWRHLFLPVIEKAFKFFDDEEFKCLLDIILKFLYDEKLKTYENFLTIFYQFWNHSSVHLKLNVSISVLIGTVKDDNVILVTKHVISDPDMMPRKSAMWNRLHELCHHYILNNNYDFADLLTKVFPSDDDLEDFLCAINCSEVCEAFINRDEFVEVDEL